MAQPATRFRGRGQTLMIERATGIILQVRPLTETSLIVEWLTEEFGRLSTAAKGARRSKSSFRGKLDLFYALEFSFSRSRKSDLHTLSEVQVKDTHPRLRRDLALLQQAAYAAKLVRQTTETDTPVPVAFALFRDFLDALGTTGAQAHVIFAFEIKLLEELGLSPKLDETALSTEARQSVGLLLESDWKRITAMQPDQKTVKQVRQFLHGFLIYHLGKIPSGRAEAVESNQ